jgi:hypothetical protein
MATFRVIIGFFVLAFLVEGKLNGLYSRPQDQRQVQALEENHDCIDFNDKLVQDAKGASDNKIYSPECDNNNCPGGCCRFHTNVLVCDEAQPNDFPQQPVSEEL